MILQFHLHSRHCDCVSVIFLPSDFVASLIVNSLISCMHTEAVADGHHYFSAVFKAVITNLNYDVKGRH